MILWNIIHIFHPKWKPSHCHWNRCQPVDPWVSFGWAVPLRLAEVGWITWLWLELLVLCGAVIISQPKTNTSLSNRRSRWSEPSIWLLLITRTALLFKHSYQVDSLTQTRSLTFSLTLTNKLFSNSICGVTAGEPWSSEGISHQHCPPPASGAPCGRDWYRHADRDPWQACWGRGGERGGGGGGRVWIQLEWVHILYFQRVQLCSSVRRDRLCWCLFYIFIIRVLQSEVALRH